MSKPVGFARQFLELMQKPDVDHIEGLSPAEHHRAEDHLRPRSTVGTVTEIYDYLRLLFARVGVPYSPATGLPDEARPSARWRTASWLSPKAPAAFMLAPIARGRKGEYRKWPSF